ncbi:Acetyltransferase (GNAT) family protein [Vibrio aerogenes CECT 7868]|uniref:Acetyltransferase (GNAT) family protein n=1 Tax=Vibrio aerogenes CECT 7868 TaxID=1216006 RepID=A0A1M5XGC2_9VIBR|nr:GNAT family N-acetyltransferase [Vibrio aerogenes]SHH98283.1 Acetyltransferase (GNAT) family protein [Vibrio aerogenes CECT 7868]
MSIELRPLSPEESGMTFPVFKTYMKPVIEAAFGWDEAFQYHGFTANLQPEWFSWVVSCGHQAGLVCYRQKAESLHIHLLVTFSSQQRQGVASRVITLLKGQACRQNLSLTLSCIKNNHPALHLYRKLGFEVQEEDEHFYNLICYDPCPIHIQ